MFAYLRAPWTPQHSRIHPSDKTQEVDRGSRTILILHLSFGKNNLIIHILITTQLYFPTQTVLLQLLKLFFIHPFTARFTTRIDALL